MIYFQNVSKWYNEDLPILDDVTLGVEQGEFISIVGASGVGKSTLLKLLYAEEFPSQGQVFFNDRSTDSIQRRLLPYYRRNFGTVFQDFKLLPNKTVFENVAFALEVDGRTTEEIAEEVPSILALVGLENRAQSYPKQLSGGEGQRVSMARALIHAPKVLIADEPTGNLDPSTALGILDLLVKINDLGTTVLLATHDKDIVNKIKRRVVTLDRGKITRDEANGRYHVI